MNDLLPGELAAARARRRFCAAAGPLLAALALPRAATALEDVPYVKTPANVVDAILAIADVGPRDTLIDLGSGDGRIVITAARRFGTRGLGIEIDPSLVELSSRLAREAGVADRASFRSQDLFETDLRGASVVTLYLLPDVNLAVRPRLLAMLAPGARVVSHDWDMGDWTPDRTVIVDVPDKPVGFEKRSRIHLWIVPAKVDGAWWSRIDGLATGATLALRQAFQVLDAWYVPAGGVAAAAEGRMDGDAIRLQTTIDGKPVRLEGHVHGERIEGSATIAGRRSGWRAVRIPAR